MKAPEITQELKGDLQVLKMRGSMDSKRFYKKNDRDGFPKYFQVRKHTYTLFIFGDRAGVGLTSADTAIYSYLILNSVVCSV